MCPVKKVLMSLFLVVAFMLSMAGSSHAITFSAYVKDMSGVFLQGVTATVVEYPTITATSNASGQFVLSGIPANTPVQIRLSLSGYTTVYTARISYSSDTALSSTTNYSLPTSSQYSALGITSGKSIIYARTRDYSNNNVAAKVVAVGGIHGAYDVTYGANCDLTMPVAYGSSAAIYCVKNVDDGDTVTVSAYKEGYTFNPRTFIGHADSVEQTSVKSTSTPVITGFSPMAATAGSPVIITGANLTAGGIPTVLFNGTPATVLETAENSITQLKVAVPSGAVSGPISVITTATATSGSFTVLPAGSSTSSAILGTMSYSGYKSGRVYVKTSDGSNVGVGFDGKKFILTGLRYGWTYTIKAFMDTTNTGIQHANDPSGELTVTISGSLQSVTLTLTDPTPVAVSAPTDLVAIRAANNSGALVTWNAPESSELPIPDSYTISWSADGSTITGSKTIAYTDKNIFFHATGVTYYYKVTANLGATAASTGWQQAQSIGSSGYTVSGTVTYNGITPTGPLYLAVVFGDGDVVYPTAIASPAAGSTAFSIPNVPPGSYNIYGFLDMNNNGIDDDGDYRLMDRNGVWITVTSSNLSNLSVPLPTTDVAVTTATGHYYYGEPGSDNSRESYSYLFYVDSQKKTPVNAALISGTNLAGPLDMMLRDNGKALYKVDVNNLGSATSGDSFTIRVQYSDASTADYTVSTQAPLMSPPMPLSPIFGVPFPTNGKPVFSWSAPLSPPASYNYSFSLHDDNWQTEYVDVEIASSATGYDSSLNDDTIPIPDTFGSYNWNLFVNDPNSNEVAYQAGFYTSATTPVISGVTPAMAVPGGTMIINGYNMNAVTSVTLGSYTPSITARSATQLTISIPSGVSGSNPLVLNFSGGSTVWFVRDSGNWIYIPTGAPGSLTATVKNQNNDLIAGAVIELVGNPSVSGTTNSSGVTTLSGLPTNNTFRLRITAPGYQPLYTWDVVSTGSATYKLSTAAQMTNAGNTAGKGLVQGFVKDGSNSADIGGATVSVVSQKGKTYTVVYYNSVNATFTGSQTDSSGLFLVLNVDHGDLLTISAAKSGYSFGNVQCKGVVESLTYGQVWGEVLVPVITSYSATSAKVGDSITVLGNNLGGVVSATVNGASATFTQIDSGSVSVTVPANASTTGVITVTTAGGTASGSTTFTILPNTLTVTLPGSGSGSVNAISGITFTCATPSTGCTADVAYGTPVTLSASASLGSTFSGWSGACGGSSCSFTMDGDKSATATFILQQNLKIGSDNYYGTLQSAFNGVANSETIMSRNMTLPDNGTVTYNRSGVAAKLKGGYDSGFSSQTGYTYLDGTLVLKQGRLVIERLAIH